MESAIRMADFDNSFREALVILITELDSYESSLGSIRLNWFSLRDDSIHWDNLFANRKYKMTLWDGSIKAEKFYNHVIPKVFEPYDDNRRQNTVVAKDLMRELYFDFDVFDGMNYYDLTEEEYRKHPSMNKVLAYYSAFFSILADNYKSALLMYNTMTGNLKLNGLVNVEKNEYSKINTYEKYLDLARDDMNIWEPTANAAFYFANKREDIISEAISKNDPRVLYGAHIYPSIASALKSMIKKLDFRDSLLEEVNYDEIRIPEFIEENNLDTYPRISSYYLIRDFNGYQERPTERYVV